MAITRSSSVRYRLQAFMLDGSLRQSVGQMTLERIERLVFVGGPIRAVTDRAERAGHDHAPDPVLEGRAQQVAGAEYVVGEDLLLVA